MKDLSDMSQSELYELAITCDYEGNPYHCEACVAWVLYNENAEAPTAPKPSKNEAARALQLLLAELPHEFCLDPETDLCERDTFKVIKRSNVRTVHRNLWILQKYLGV